MKFIPFLLATALAITRGDPRLGAPIRRLLVVTNFGPESLTESGYGRIAKIWRRLLVRCPERRLRKV